MAANGPSRSATPIRVLPLATQEISANGSMGIALRRRTRLTAKSAAKRIPATAAARGVLTRRGARMSSTCPLHPQGHAEQRDDTQSDDQRGDDRGHRVAHGSEVRPELTKLLAMLEPAQHERHQPDQNHHDTKNLRADVRVAQAVVLRQVAKDLVDGEAEGDQGQAGSGPRHQSAFQREAVAFGGEPSVRVQRRFCHRHLASISKEWCSDENLLSATRSAQTRSRP